MSEPESTPSEDLVVALIAALLRKGILTASDVGEMADRLDRAAAGEPVDTATRLRIASDLANSAILEAMDEPEAANPPKLRVVSNDDA